MSSILGTLNFKRPLETTDCYPQVRAGVSTHFVKTIPKNAVSERSPDLFGDRDAVQY